MFVDLEKLDRIIDQVQSDLLSVDVEELLIQFYEIKKQIEETEHLIKERIEEAALNKSPDFTKYQGKRVSIRYQAYGAKYKIDPNQVEALPKNLFKVETKYSPIAKEVDAYKAVNHGLPQGIVENERKKSISISINKTGGA